MSNKYAKDQPAGFTNRIEKVAIVGVGGTIGSYLTKALVDAGKHTVTAISRVGSTSKIPEGVNVAYVDYDDEESLVAALKGQQFLAITMSPWAMAQQKKLIDAAAKAGVPWVMPNCYGPDVDNVEMGKESHTGPPVWAAIKDIEEAGVSSWTTMSSSYWYEYSVSTGPSRYGFDIPNRKMTFYDDGKFPMYTTTWLQTGRALASLLDFKELPEDENDQSPTLSRWRNRGVYINSFVLSQREMLDSVQRVTGTTDSDWTIESESSETRYLEAEETLKKGDYSAFAKAMYARSFYPSEEGKFAAGKGLDNEVLGLPKEDLDEATTRAVKLADAGFVPAYN